MKLNFKGFFKAAGLFPLALMLSGCISYALVSHTAKGSSGKWICPYISRHLLSLNPLQARCRRYSRGER